MIDFPPGQWSPLLMGHQWPDASSIVTLQGASTNRDAAGHAFDTYADALQTIRLGPLGAQEGVTADDTRAAFQTGEQHARELSSKYLAIAESHRSALRST